MTKKNKYRRGPRENCVSEHTEQSIPVKNLGWFYYKYYYKDLGSDLVVDYNNLNQSLFDYLLPDKIDYQPFKGDEVSFSLITTYPGLIMGTGVSHETGSKNKEEFKLGLSFDYTSGLPVIPGASIKGLLRSVFPNSIKKKKKKEEEKILEETYRTPRRKYIQEKCNRIGVGNVDVESLENEIFEGVYQSGEDIPVYYRDIFFDAFPELNKNETHTKILEEDYIAPHTAGVFKEPIPVHFLKIKPQVRIRFYFKLHDGIIKAEDKKALFRQILLDIGIGAKTNVGYGQLEDPDKK